MYVLRNQIHTKRRSYELLLFYYIDMKTLYTYINESLLDDEDIVMQDAIDKINENIQQFLKANYIGYKKCKILDPVDGKYIVDCDGHLEVKNRSITSLTNGEFEFGYVDGNFECPKCSSLTSLEGAPKKISGGFNCSKCSSLVSLEGISEEVGGVFNCSDCTSLTSLKGAPKKIGDSFFCIGCKSLTSLEGAPKEIPGTFNCSDCSSLISLKGAPKKVKRDFFCDGCGKQFTYGDIKRYSNVGFRSTRFK
jgi:DNA-directed RNA polymerase subunit RPC12/RpoP